MALGAIASRKDNLEHKLHKTKKLNDRLDNDINKLENVLLKKDIILSRAHHKETIQNSDIDKKIQTYENRLNKEMVTYNKMLTENNKLREQIQHIRREHAKFEAKNNRLDAILEEKRQLQAAMVDDGNLAFDSQEDAKQRGLGLADRNDKDLLQHSLEYKELQRHLDNEDDTKKFMDEKGEDRGSLAQQEINRRMLKIIQKSEKVGAQKLEAYKESFGVIYDIYGTISAEALLAELQTKESETFALYNYINDLNKNIEKEHESIAGFKYNTQKTQVATGLYLAEMIQKTDALVELKTKIGVTLDGLIVQYEEQSRTFDFMCQGIQTIFTRTGCEKKIIAQSLGDHTTINANNVLDHLALVERQANRLIGHYVKSQQEANPDMFAKTRVPSQTSRQGTDDGALDDVVIPPAIEDSELYNPTVLVNATDIRKKTNQVLDGREIDRRRLSEDFMSQQQRSFAKRADQRRMTLI